MKEGRAEAAAICGNGEIPLIVFIGDGVSDLPAAREADVLFARKGLRLEEYCIENQIPYIAFENFSEIKKEVEKIIPEAQEQQREIVVVEEAKLSTHVCPGTSQKRVELTFDLQTVTPRTPVGLATSHSGRTVATS